jgi:hypothetical protein
MAAFCGWFSICFNGSQPYEEVQKEEVPLQQLQPDNDNDWDGFDDGWDVDQGTAETDATEPVDSVTPVARALETAEVIAPAQEELPDVPIPEPARSPKAHSNRTNKAPKAEAQPPQPQNDYFADLGMAPTIMASEVVVTRIKRAAPAVTPAPAPKPRAPAPVISTPAVAVIEPPSTYSSSRFDMDMDLDDADMGDMGDMDFGLGLDLDDDDLVDTLDSDDIKSTNNDDAPVTLAFSKDLDAFDDSFDDDLQAVPVMAPKTKTKTKTKKERKRKDRKKKGLGVVALS